MGVGPDRIMLSAFRTTAALRRCSPVALDWAKMASQVTTDSGRAELAALRGEISEINKSLDSVPDGVASVDWAHWKSRIQTPGAVDQFEAAFNSLQVPTLQDTFTAELTSKFNAAIAAAEDQAVNAQAQIARLEQELVDLQAAKDDLYNKTVEDELAANPELEAEIEGEIADNYWK